MAVLTLTDRLRVLQQFASDPQALATAIKNFRPEEQILRPGAPPAESHGTADMPGAGGGSAMIMMASQAVHDFAYLEVGTTSNGAP